MQIDIVGMGAIGNLLAMKCVQKKINFRILTRDGAPCKLTAKTVEGEHIDIRLNVSNITNSVSRNIIILPLKAYQILPAVHQLKANLKPDQIVVLLHNGMGTIDAVVDALPEQPIVAATTSYGSYKPSRWEVCATGAGETQAGWIQASSNGMQADAHALLSTLLPPCHWEEDIRYALWQKLAVNAVINPLTALAGVSNGGLKEARFEDDIVQVCEEAIAVMSTEGYPMDLQNLRQRVHNVIENTALNFSSMNRDVVNSRRTEIDYINGYIVQRAEKLGIQVPKNREMLDKIKEIEASQLTPKL